MGLLRKLAGETALYGVSSIIGRLLNYFLVPLYTAVFAAAEYGIVTELYAYIAFLNILFTYGLETAYFRFSTKEQANESNIFNLSLTSIFGTTLLLSCAVFLFSSEISSLLGYEDQRHIIRWIAGILAVDAIVAIPFARLRLESKARYFVLVKLTNISINVALNLFFIVLAPTLSNSTFVQFIYVPEWSIEYIFLSNLLANAFMLILLWKSFYNWRISFNWQELKPLLLYAYPILFTGIAGVTNEMLSRAMLRHWLPEGFYGEQSNLAALGVFGACYKISVFMTLAVQAFRYAAEPFFFSNASDKNSPDLFANVMNWFIIFGAFSFLVISLNLDILGYLFLRSPEYREGLYVVPYLLLGGLFLGIYYNLSVWYKLTDQTIYGAYLSIGGALLTFLFNYLLIPYLGYLGSAMTTLLTYFGMAAMSYGLGKNKYPVPYKTGRGMFYVAIAVVLFQSTQQLSGNLETSIIGRIISIIAFVIAVVLIEGKNVRNLFKS